MRQNFNYHTHTYRCGHATMDADEQYVIEAINAGFRILGMSDHAPYPDRSKKTDRMDIDLRQDYLDSIRSLKEKYAGKIDIKIGFEMEYFPCYRQYIDELASLTDYLLLGQHYPDADAEKDYAHDSMSDEEIRLYGQLVEEGMKTGRFLYLAHPDYFCGGIQSFNKACQETTHRICQCAVETSTPLEVNIKLINRKKKMYPDGLHYIYPYSQFWKIVSQYPVKCVYGFDVHDPKMFRLTEEAWQISDQILEGISLDFIKEPLL